ncbi:MAG: hypothetical protein I8H75_03485 [Myxococcaceae bacterium]|nr:hypothetical protein [Myxococcaceae bacterium]MBH2006391.1 hypothetical protein [Myxococcaceae bacterium]
MEYKTGPVEKVLELRLPGFMAVPVMEMMLGDVERYVGENAELAAAEALRFVLSETDRVKVLKIVDVGVPELETV